MIAIPQWPPAGYQVRQEGKIWRALARYGTWQGPARGTFLEALQDARQRAQTQLAKGQTMLYTDRDLTTEERNAWQRGDYAAAELLALAIDTEEIQSKLDNIREWITRASWRTGKKADLRELVEQIIAELADA